MNRWLNRQCGCGYTPGLAADVVADEGEFDEFKGKVHFQDLAELDGNTENSKVGNGLSRELKRVCQSVGPSNGLLTVPLLRTIQLL